MTPDVGNDALPPRFSHHPAPLACVHCGALVEYSWPGGSGPVCGRCRWDEFGHELLLERFVKRPTS